MDSEPPRIMDQLNYNVLPKVKVIKISYFDKKQTRIKIYGSFCDGVASYQGGLPFDCSVFKLEDDIFRMVAETAASQFRHTNSFLRVYGIDTNANVIITERVICNLAYFFMTYARKTNISLVRGRFLTKTAIDLLRGILTCMREFSEQHIYHEQLNKTNIFVVGGRAHGFEPKFLFGQKSTADWITEKSGDMICLRVVFDCCLKGLPKPEHNFDNERISFCLISDYSPQHVQYHPYLLYHEQRIMVPVMTYTTLGSNPAPYDLCKPWQYDVEVGDWITGILAQPGSQFHKTYKYKVQSQFPYENGQIYSAISYMRNHTVHRGSTPNQLTLERLNNDFASLMGPNYLVNIYNYFITYHKRLYYY